MFKHTDFKSKPFTEEPPNIQSWQDPKQYPKRRELWKNREKQHYDNEQMMFETRKEQLFEFLKNTTQEDLLKEIVHLHVFS